MIGLHFYASPETQSRTETVHGFRKKIRNELFKLRF